MTKMFKKRLPKVVSKNQRIPRRKISIINKKVLANILFLIPWKILFLLPKRMTITKRKMNPNKKFIFKEILRRKP